MPSPQSSAHRTAIRIIRRYEPDPERMQQALCDLLAEAAARRAAQAKAAGDAAAVSVGAAGDEPAAATETTRPQTTEEEPSP